MRRDILSTYCTVSSSDRFEFLYEYYHNYKNILSCERHCVIYMIECFMMKNHWENAVRAVTIEEDVGIVEVYKGKKSIRYLKITGGLSYVFLFAILKELLNNPSNTQRERYA